MISRLATTTQSVKMNISHTLVASQHKRTTNEDLSETFNHRLANGLRYAASDDQRFVTINGGHATTSIEDSHFTPSVSNHPAARANIHPTSNNTYHRVVDTDARQLTNHLRTSDVNNKTINGNLTIASNDNQIVQIVDSHTSINYAVIPPYGIHIAMNDEIPGAVNTVTAVTVDGRSVTSVTSDGYHPSTSGVSMSDNESSIVLVEDVPNQVMMVCTLSPKGTIVQMTVARQPIPRDSIHMRV